VDALRDCLRPVHPSSSPPSSTALGHSSTGHRRNASEPGG
jgi:hypothetical protein